MLVEDAAEEISEDESDRNRVMEQDPLECVATSIKKEGIEEQEEELGIKGEPADDDYDLEAKAELIDDIVKSEYIM